MTLCDVGVGLLKTHVTWEDVEEVLTESLGIECKLGPNRSATHIGEGRGFLSRIALVDPDWTTEDDRLPKKFAVKICSQLPQMEYDEENAQTPEMQKLFKEMHNSEVDAYEMFEKYRTPGLKAAHMFASRRFTKENPLKGFIIISFFENLDPVHIVDNMNMNEVEQVLEAIAEMNAVTLRLSDDERSKIVTDMFSSVCATYFTNDLITRNVQSVRRFAGEYYPELVNKLDEIKFEITSKDYFKHMDELCVKLGMTPLITHGDLWTTNLLWSKPGENYKLEAIVDYQSPVLSTPAVDISAFICSALSGQERLEKTDYILERYYSLLETKVQGKIPFTLDQLKESYIHIFPFHGFEILGTFVEIYADFLERGENVGRKLPEFPQVLEKIHGLLKSIVDYYDLCKTGNRW